jgi:hypothetical protein
VKARVYFSCRLCISSSSSSEFGVREFDSVSIWNEMNELNFMFDDDDVIK